MVSATTIDCIVLAFLALALVRGLRLGALKSLLEPVALGIGLLIAYIYYLNSKNLWMSVVLSVLIPLGIKIIFGLGLKILNKAANPKESISWGSRLIGALISLGWSVFQTALILILMVMAPVHMKWFTDVKESILQSKSYVISQPLASSVTNINLDKTQNIARVLENPKVSESVIRTKEYKEIMDDQKVQNFMDDPESMKNLEERNFMRLMGDKKFQEILKDKELLKKFFILAEKIGQAS